MNINTSVYWIHHPEHTNMFTQGYIGVSNNTKVRWNEHSKRPSNLHIQRAIAKYGWDILVKEVVLVADKDYCLDIETKLRPENQIGWNVVLGGGSPPHINIWNKGRKMPQDELDSRKAKGFGFNKGHKTWNAGLAYTEEMKSKIYDIGSYTRGMTAHNKGKPIHPNLLAASRKAQLGRIQSDEERHKKSLANKGRVFEKVICPNCQKEGGITSMKRWHFDNCTGNKIFTARVTIDGKRIFLGSFTTKELANIAIEKSRKGCL